MLVQYVKYGCRVDPEPHLTAMYACRSNYPVHVYRDPNCQRRVDTIRYGTFVLIDTALGEIDYKPPPSLANSHTDIISPSVEVSSVAPEELIPRTDTGISTSSSGTCEYHTSAVKRNSEHSVTSVVTNYDAILENNRLPWSRIVFPAVGYVQQRTVAGHCLHPISARHTSHDTIYPCEALPLSEGLLRRENTNQLTEDTASEAPNGSPLPLRIPKTASSKNIPTSAVKLSRFSHKEKYVDAQKHLYSASDTDGLQEDNSLYDTRNSQQQQQRERRTLKEKVFRFIGFGKKSKKELNT
ncbi:hypothetical protein, conserved [Angomonas deanei]|uniref:Uncharacterized protein n=1 Tax=Angomonas deanei TaxID=59799 RepID=A0A7G2C7Q1_9TRYP|nr:hypothetical protein, conserved [Angomonas deanei]